MGGSKTTTTGSVLFADRDPAEHSTPDDAFEPEEIDVEAVGDGEFVVQAPPSSVVAVTLDV